MKMKKVLAIALALAMVFCLVGCKKPDPQPEPKEELLKVKTGVTVPEFSITVNGVTVTNVDMNNSDFDVYEATVKSVNTSGTESSTVFVGFKLADVVKVAKLEGTATGFTATCTDGYAKEFEGLNENAMVAISKDGTQFKQAPWFVPCDSATTGDQLKGCNQYKIKGMTAPGQEAEPELADPDKQDKTGKVTFADFSFKIDGKEIKNADLEGLSIYKITGQVKTKTGEIQDHTYAGYLVKDIFDKLSIDAGSVKAVASDGYEKEFGASIVKGEYTLLAIECDKNVGENGTVWFANCASHEANNYAKLIVELKTK